MSEDRSQWTEQDWEMSELKEQIYGLHKVLDAARRVIDSDKRYLEHRREVKGLRLAITLYERRMLMSAEGESQRPHSKRRNP